MQPIVIFVVFLSAFVSASIATVKGRNPIGWFVIGLMFPVLSVVLGIVLPDVNKLDEALKAP